MPFFLLFTPHVLIIMIRRQFFFMLQNHVDFDHVRYLPGYHEDVDEAGVLFYQMLGSQLPRSTREGADEASLW